MGFRGRQDHYNAYVEDFTILQMVDGSKVVQFEENPNKHQAKGVKKQNPKFSTANVVYPTLVKGIPYDVSKSGLHANPNQWEIPALYTLQLFLGMKQQ